MINIIRADIYRIIRGKTLYVTLAVVIAVVAINIAGGSISIGIQYASDSAAEITENATRAESLFQMVRDLTSMSFFVIPMFMITAVTMFTYGTVKNELSAGTSRVTLYFAKLLLSCVLCAVGILVYVLAGTIAIFIFWGSDGVPGWETVSTMIKSIGGQFVILAAFTSVGLFLSFATRRAAAVNSIMIAFIILPSMAIQILSLFNSSIRELGKYELYSCLSEFSRIGSMTNGDIVRCLMVGVVWIALSITGSLMIFRKCEIK